MTGNQPDLVSEGIREMSAADCHLQVLVSATYQDYVLDATNARRSGIET